MVRKMAIHFEFTDVIADVVHLAISLVKNNSKFMFEDAVLYGGGKEELVDQLKNNDLAIFLSDSTADKMNAVEVREAFMKTTYSYEEVIKMLDMMPINH
ncbi:hypothetical protein SAMD00019534_036300 [Acytostelium subglobosum LB1]|uniref:hypothetical protein n=1 Tax=Acytostelium subglobosum LB1 TaxID=1410327 RepID=UPI000644ADEE|nr:hypothetical protein SAMD00019534_036300 [Acytostelium subglobosum LB1]GAM20455.1 hypothetical protein SAMD00019534_036300 [Acytostelium subglobosum LB1]|eukprot:XP_012759976.1 hypothetical protein SAMD00019534_036300 [Acytostelium subglobosum LB1]